MPNDGTPRSDNTLLARIQAGSQGAAAEFHDRYAKRLLALTRARTGTDLRTREDPEDIVQSVFGSFFRGTQSGFYMAPPGEELWNLLLVIALNKIRAKGEFHRAAKRDVRRTVGEAALSGRDGATFEPPADDTSAGNLLRLVVAEVMDSLPVDHREVARLRMEGCEVAEIAAVAGRSKRTVERILQEFRTRMMNATGMAGHEEHRPAC